MSDIDDLLKDTASRIFRDTCTRSALDSAERGEWPEEIWSAAHASGLTSALNPELDDGSLLPLETLAVIVRAAGEFSVPLPIVETLLAQRLFVQAGLSFPEGPLSIAPDVSKKRPQLTRLGDGWQLDGTVRRVPWGRHARAVAVIAEHNGEVALVRLEDVSPTREGKNLAGEPRDGFDLRAHALPADAVCAGAASLVNSLNSGGALFRSLQIAGAMGRILDQTVQYSTERVQFGRAIAKFQAIQQQVAILAAQTAAAAAAAEAAVLAASSRSADFEIAAAKLRCSEAVGIGCNVAHQVHGAMGFTHEHSLHLSTRRLMSWRDEFGSEAEWALWIGQRIQEIGGANLWGYISTPQLHEDSTQPNTIR
jgi:acyl-CoA dehydrogenase